MTISTSRESDRQERAQFYREFGEIGLTWHAQGKTRSECQAMQDLEKRRINSGFSAAFWRFMQGTAPPSK